MSHVIKVGSEKGFQPNTSRKFSYIRDRRKREGFVVNWHGKYFAYENVCQHLAVSLDMDDNDFFDYSEKYLVCKTHGAFYKPDSGECVGGPPIGQKLLALSVRLENNEIWVEIP